MHASKYHGVILAAGHGSRMGPFGEALPKPIAPICNKPLLAYQLDYFAKAGIHDVVIVIGHLGHRITQTLGDGSRYGVRIRYVEQEKRLGLAHAVGQLEPHVSGPFVLALGDIYFEMEGLHPLIEAFESGDTAAALAVKEESDPEAIKRNFAVIPNPDGTIRRVIEKPRTVPNRLKGCGIYLFDDRIFEAVRRTPRTAMRDEYELTDSIQILIDYEYPVRAVDLVQWDVNVTYVEDLLTCCLRRLKQSGRRVAIAEGAAVHDGAELIDTVIGADVVVPRPMRLERCVVLEGSRIPDEPEIRDAVITPEGVLRADPARLQVHA